MNGRSPLHLAAFIDSPKEILEMTLTENTNLEEHLDGNGRSVLEMAKLHSDENWKKFIESRAQAD